MAQLLLSAEWGKGPAWPQMCLLPTDQKRIPNDKSTWGPSEWRTPKARCVWPWLSLTFVPKAEEHSIYRRTLHLQQRIQIILIIRSRQEGLSCILHSAQLYEPWSNKGFPHRSSANFLREISWTSACFMESSLNHRMICFGKEVQDHPIPPQCHGQEHCPLD